MVAAPAYPHPQAPTHRGTPPHLARPNQLARWWCEAGDEGARRPHPPSPRQGVSRDGGGVGLRSDHSRCPGRQHGQARIQEATVNKLGGAPRQERRRPTPPPSRSSHRHQPQTQNLTPTTLAQPSTNKKPARITPLRALAVQAAINQTSTSARSTTSLKQLITGCQRARRCQQRLGRYRYTSSPCRTCRQCDADRAPRLQRGWHRLRPGGGPER